ncbi:class I SAM-dependent methyltransferase [Chloroflexota bacterium]
MNLVSRVLFYLFYLGDPPWDSGISPPELVRFIEENPPGRALDLGCGTGTNAITLAKSGWQVQAVDFVGKAIRTARRKARQANAAVDFHREDVTRLQGIHGPFDLVLDIGCFHNLAASGQAAYIDNLERLLAAGGTFLMYAYFQQPDQSGGVFGSGLDEASLAQFEGRLRLVNREDGSERGRRPSAWFWFRR